MKILYSLLAIAIGFASCQKDDDAKLPEEKTYHLGSYVTEDSTDEGHFEYWDDYTKSFFKEINWDYETEIAGGVDSFNLNMRQLKVNKMNTTTYFSFYTKPYVSYKGLLVFPDKYKSVNTSIVGDTNTTNGITNLSADDTLNIAAGGTGRFYYAFYNQHTKLVYTKGHYDIKFVAQ